MNYYELRFAFVLSVIAAFSMLPACESEVPEEGQSDTQSADSFSDGAGSDDSGDVEDAADTSDDDPGDASDTDDAFDADDSNTFVDECDCVGSECGSDAAPTAILEVEYSDGTPASEPVEIAPFTTLDLDASSSTGPSGSGAVLAYHWRWTSRPDDATVELLPTSSVRAPRIFVDLVGEYGIELQVRTTEEATTACSEPVRATIIATPEHDVYIELTTETPADPIARDDDGTSVGLHYLHPLGTWNGAPWDCYWNNTDPDWGASGEQSDDPSLFASPVGDPGPEVAKHSKLEGLIYQVGIYYLKGDVDGTPVTTYATLRVYLEGALAAEIEDVELDREEEFYRAGFVDGGSLEWEETGRFYDGFPNN